jgi:hypothetical protein
MQSSTVEKIKRIKKYRRDQESNTVRQDKDFKRERRIARAMKEMAFIELTREVEYER